MLLLLVFVSLTTVVTAQSSSFTASDDSEDMDEYILAPSPILKISSPVRNIIWSNDSSLFAFSDEKNLIIADGKNNAISEIIHTDGIIRDIQVSRGASNEDVDLV